MVFLDAQHRVIAIDELFRGTLTQTSVYPREVVKEALAHNAAAVILAHNHPSGSATPSGADESLTRNLRQTLALVDVRVLDHLIVTPHPGAQLRRAGASLASAWGFHCCRPSPPSQGRISAARPPDVHSPPPGPASTSIRVPRAFPRSPFDSEIAMGNNYFATLSAINVNDHIEKKGGFSYLSWPWAVSQLRMTDPTASWEVKRFNGLPYLALRPWSLCRGRSHRPGHHAEPAAPCARWPQPPYPGSHGL